MVEAYRGTCYVESKRDDDADAAADACARERAIKDADMDDVGNDDSGIASEEVEMDDVGDDGSEAGAAEEGGNYTGNLVLRRGGGDEEWCLRRGGEEDDDSEAGGDEWCLRSGAEGADFASTVVPKGRFLSFEPARTFVHSLKLTSQKMWEAYSKSGKRPLNIPSRPATTYRKSGWLSMPDWLGYEKKEVMAQGGALAFEAARTFVHSLKLTNLKMWHAYSKSGKRPLNIPSSPSTVYRESGWLSMPD